MVREQRFPQSKTFPCDDELAKQIDEYRWTNRVSSESEAIRQLIAAGLAAKQASQGSLQPLPAPKVADRSRNPGKPGQDKPARPR